MKGIKNFKNKENNLKEIEVSNIGNILFLNFGHNNKLNNIVNKSNNDNNDYLSVRVNENNLNNENENDNNINNINNENNDNTFSSLISPFIRTLKENNFDPSFSDLEFVQRKEYPIKSNWKVFIDNFCDGGYHVPFAHKDLNSNLDLSTYRSEIYKKSSLQIVKGNESNRIGNSAVYCYLYPNILFNRYGPWLDINVVIPISESECLVIIEWFVDRKLLNEKIFIEESLKKSELVQLEDVELCENVMKGIKSDAYDRGRYVPSKEGPAYQFHLDLLNDLSK
jgi:phenylpropionate dioxygenase-like ring-hydroxylating dioxygenase large terminal subunit